MQKFWPRKQDNNLQSNTSAKKSPKRLPALILAVASPGSWLSLRLKEPTTSVEVSADRHSPFCRKLDTFLLELGKGGGPGIGIWERGREGESRFHSRCKVRRRWKSALLFPNCEKGRVRRIATTDRPSVPNPFSPLACLTYCTYIEESALHLEDFFGDQEEPGIHAGGGEQHTKKVWKEERRRAIKEGQEEGRKGIVRRREEGKGRRAIFAAADGPRRYTKEIVQTEEEREAVTANASFAFQCLFSCVPRDRTSVRDVRTSGRFRVRRECRLSAEKEEQKGKSDRDPHTCVRRSVFVHRMRNYYRCCYTVGHRNEK